jgi:hypothetical protein
MSTKMLPHHSIGDHSDFLGLRVNPMSKQTIHYRTYDPKSLIAMGIAFDAALDGFPDKDRANARIRRELALLIIYLADQGETDPTRLSRLALVTMKKRDDDFDLSLAARVFRFRLIANQPL